jgi:hypothetical protein
MPPQGDKPPAPAHTIHNLVGPKSSPRIRVEGDLCEVLVQPRATRKLPAPWLVT